MRILVLNSGSSSIKFSAFESDTETGLTDPHSIMDGELGGIGSANTALQCVHARRRASDECTFRGKCEINRGSDSTCLYFGLQRSRCPAVRGCWISRGSSRPYRLNDHQRITPALLAELEEAVAFAPLHNPPALAVMREGLARFPDIPHFACFDTVFHRTMPEEAITYACCSAEYR